MTSSYRNAFTITGNSTVHDSYLDLDPVISHHMMFLTPHPSTLIAKLFIMESNHQNLKGYDHQFVESPPDDLLCLICLSVVREPQQISCCGKVLCKVCLDELRKEHSNLCPQCRVDIVSFTDKRSKLKIDH